MTEANKNLLEAILLRRGGISMSTLARHFNIPHTLLEAEWEDWLKKPGNTLLASRGSRGFTSMEAALFATKSKELSPPKAPDKRGRGRPPKGAKLTPQEADEPTEPPETPKAEEEEAPVPTAQSAPVPSDLPQVEELQGTVAALREQLANATNDNEAVRGALQETRQSETGLTNKLNEARKEAHKLGVKLEELHGELETSKQDTNKWREQATIKDGEVFRLAEQVRGLEHLETLGRTLASVAAGVEALRQGAPAAQSAASPTPEVPPRVVVEGFAALVAFLQGTLGRGSRQELSKAQSEDRSFSIWSLEQSAAAAIKERDAAQVELKKCQELLATREKDIKHALGERDGMYEVRDSLQKEANSLLGTLAATEIALAGARDELKRALKERDAGREALAELLREKTPSNGPSSPPADPAPVDPPKGPRLRPPGPGGALQTICASPKCKTPETIGKVIKGLCPPCYKREWELKNKANR